MSNRTLIEINHDYAGEIDNHHIEVMAQLLSYLRAGGTRSKQELERYGIKVLGMRHHSDGFDIKWGFGPRITEKGDNLA